MGPSGQWFWCGHVGRRRLSPFIGPPGSGVARFVYHAFVQLRRNVCIPVDDYGHERCWIIFVRSVIRLFQRIDHDAIFSAGGHVYLVWIVLAMIPVYETLSISPSRTSQGCAVCMALLRSYQNGVVHAERTNYRNCHSGNRYECRMDSEVQPGDPK